MRRLLYIKASPRAARSHSRAVADAFVAVYRARHPDATVDELDLFSEDLPDFDGAVIDAKYRILHGEEAEPAEKEAWKGVEAIIERFKKADRYLLAVPMWNFGIPYRLKQYFDLILQPGYTFSFSPEEGYSGMISGARAVMVYARGGSYAPGTPTEPYDMQKPYVEAILAFMGIADQQSLLVEETLAGDAGASRDAAIADARDMAGEF